ncbi:uncharacterized protein J4E79_011066 [Alternaria viburni]|uniref:uncharacterized protein n=1 Tax=Alternaria viburni TaxID=566460 RepID=UPI0020C41CF9|nr:uncharacterized protein J4E79_011066 [Alternaria viburni]KAI4644629.1 hypothetical protein J4E79_011066 [Alternaria viburni]
MAGTILHKGTENHCKLVPQQAGPSGTFAAMNTHYVESAQTMVIAPEESDSDPWSSSDDEDSSSENETESGGNSASSASDPDEDYGLPPAVKSAYHLHLKYEDKAMRALEHATSMIEEEESTQEAASGSINAPTLPIYGEYTLYSPVYLQTHYKNFPTLWTDQFASTWTAGSICFEKHLGSDGDLGAECVIPGIERPLTFGYFEALDRVCQGDRRPEDDGVISPNEDTKGISLWFCEGPYLIIAIPPEELGGTADEYHYVFVGILDKTEEDMATTGLVTDYKSRSASQDEAPYTFTLPQSRTRYLAPTSSTGPKPSDQGSCQLCRRADLFSGKYTF